MFEKFLTKNVSCRLYIIGGWIMKKSILAISAAALIVLAISALILLPGKINNYNLDKYANEVLSSVNLPQKTEMIEYVSGFGNSTGAGDHTDLYVAILLKSELSWEELSETFGRVHIVETSGDKTLAMELIGLEFKTNTADSGYYIVESRKSGILDGNGC